MNKISLVSFALLTSLAYGCANPGKVTGGGRVIAEDGTALATFALHGDTCSGDLTNPNGHFNWVDQKSGVKMKGTLSGLSLCVEEDDWQGVWGDFACLYCMDAFGPGTFAASLEYTSTNPKQPGSGYATGCLKDNGEGINAVDGDKLALFVDTGVYGGYSAQGTVRGNVQEHACDAP